MGMSNSCNLDALGSQRLLLGATVQKAEVMYRLLLLRAVAYPVLQAGRFWPRGAMRCARAP